MSLTLKTIADIPNKIHPLNKSKTTDQESDASDGLGRDYVKLLTYNLFLRPLVKNNESDHKYPRLAEFSKVLNDFDIICNQEVFSGMNCFKGNLIAMSAKAGFIYKVVPSKPNFWSKHLIDSGLLILSRFPIVDKEELIYKKFLQDCSPSSKGALYAKIEIGGSYLHLFNTHLQANYFHSSYVYKRGIEVRMYQLKELRDFVARKTKDANPNDCIMVVGDFNISSRKTSEVWDKNLKEFAKEDSGFDLFTDPEYDSLREHEVMLKILGHDDEFEVIDCK